MCALGYQNCAFEACARSRFVQQQRPGLVGHAGVIKSGRWLHAGGLCLPTSQPAALPS